MSPFKEVKISSSNLENSFLDCCFRSVFRQFFIVDFIQVRDIKAEKCKGVISHANAIFVDDKFPSAKEMCSLSYDKHKKNDIFDVAYFEPFYLEIFIVVSQKKKMQYYKFV